MSDTRTWPGQSAVGARTGVPITAHDPSWREGSSGDSWTRRTWIMRHLLMLLPGITLAGRPRWASRASARPSSRPAGRPLGAGPTARPLDPSSWQALAARAVDAATAAGASYADSRLTRVVRHEYTFAGAAFTEDTELIGIGVRVLVQGAWGFAASAVTTADEAVRLAQDAVRQARANSKGATPWTVDLGTIPVATGTWMTPVRIDPFAISIEEKRDYMIGILHLADRVGMPLRYDGATSHLRFLREERVVATSEGARFMQTTFEGQGIIECNLLSDRGPAGNGDPAQRAFANLAGGGTIVDVEGLGLAAMGWELVMDANVPEQLLSGQLRATGERLAALGARPLSIGKYTLVCDGATMARLVESTLGVTTQLDRALGYEANAHGTTAITDPLAMVGHTTLAAPLVTVTANRSEPGALATVHWDDEGVTPTPFPLIKEGVLVDFQTTREQAAWLAPYYQRQGQPVRSHGCAASESAHLIPMQHMPNLSLEPSAAAIRTEELIADISQGVWIEGGNVLTSDSQARSGLLVAGGTYGGRMRQIKNGRLGAILEGGAVLYDAETLWKQLHAIGGASTTAVVATSVWYDMNPDVWKFAHNTGSNDVSKGEPPQLTSHSVRAAAATLPNQAVIDLNRKA